MTESQDVASVWDHVEDLRQVLIRSLMGIGVGVGILFYFSKDILHLFLQLVPKGNGPLVMLTPQEGLVTLFKVSFWGGLVLTSPYWLFQVAQFIKPALRSNERGLFSIFLSISFLFVSAGIALCYFITLPIASQYLFEFNQEIGQNLWTFSSFVDFVFLLLLSHAIVFEIGAFLLLLVHVGVIRYAMLAEKRRHAAIVSLIVGAITTPPDIFTQLCVAVPLYGFFELALFYSRLRPSENANANANANASANVQGSYS